MNKLVNYLRMTLYKFGLITALKCMSAFGILVSSFYISAVYGLSEFGGFSYVMAISGLIMVSARMGVEYTAFKYFLPKYNADREGAFEDLQEVIINSVIISIILLTLVMSLLDIPKKLTLFLIFHTLIFSIIQPLSFAFRSIEKFKVAYLFEMGTFLLLITVFWVLTKLIFNLDYIEASLIIYPIYFLLFLNKVKNIIKLKGVRVKKQVARFKNNMPFLGYTLSEYICFWGVLLVSGLLLSDYDTGLVSWGTRFFQFFVLVVSIRNSLDVPRILKSMNIKEALKANITNNFKLVIAFSIIPVVFYMVILNATLLTASQESVVAMFLFFYLAAVIRFAFGPICHVFTSISRTSAILGNLLVVLVVCSFGFSFVFFYGVSAVGFAYLMTWLSTLLFSYYSIFHVKEYK